MNEMLKVVLSLSLSGSLVMLILFLLRPVLKERLSKQWQYYIWLVVIARLLLPFAADINLMGPLFQGSTGGFVQTAFYTPPMQQGSASAPEIDLPPGGSAAGELDIPQNGQPETTGTADNPTQNIPLVIAQNLWLGWLVVALILFIRKMTIYQSFVKYIRAGCVEVTDIDLLERLGKLTEQSNLKKAVELHTNSLISSPLLIGFFRPCIVLPTTNLSISDFQYTILHELTHYKRRDMFYKWLLQFTICLHWFNPLVYFMSLEVSRSCELSCDEAVIKKLDTEGQRAYGDTLMNAIGAGGSYKNSFASVTLNESKELLKERLDAIMGFKKPSRFTVAISIALAFVLCFGATTVGVYAVDGNLTLVTKEYTIDELKALDISGVVIDALSENVTIVSGGNTLKFEYYIKSQDEYTMLREDDGGKTRWNLCLSRITPIATNENSRSITVSIPEGFDITLFKARTDSGDIDFKNFVGKWLFAETESGQINLNGGSVTDWMIVRTNTGNALISGTSLPASVDATMIETQIGTIAFQPKDTVKNYRFIVDAGADAQVTVNSKKFGGGDYEINARATKQVYFDSPSGSLIVQDLNQGELSFPTATQPNPIVPSVQPTAPTDSSNLTLVKKEYTESDLQQMGITGFFMESLRRPRTFP